MKSNQTTLNCLIEAITDHLYEFEIQESLVFVRIIPEATNDLLIYMRDDGVEIARQELPSSGCLQDVLTFTFYFNGDCWITIPNLV